MNLRKTMTLSLKRTLYDHLSYHIDKKIMSSQRQCLRFLLWEFLCTCPNQGRNGLSVEEGLGSQCSIPQLYIDSLCGNSLAENWQQTLSCYQHHEDSLSKHTRCTDFIISWNISNFNFFTLQQSKGLTNFPSILILCLWYIICRLSITLLFFWQEEVSYSQIFFQYWKITGRQHWTWSQGQVFVPLRDRKS